MTSERDRLSGSDRPRASLRARGSSPRRSPGGRRALPFVALGLAALACVSIAWIDRPLARFLADHGASWDPLWRHGVDAAEVATGMPVWKWLAGATLLGAGAVAAALRRGSLARALWFVGAVHLASRISGNWLKAGFERLRPGQWLERGAGDSFFVDGGVAFPSGHVAHFLGLVLPLAVLRPRIGLPLLVVPVLVGWARVATNAHFLADVLAAAAWTTAMTVVFAAALRITSSPRSPGDRSR
jgi:membrane-associated phospholipid phosphatase